MKIDLHCHTKKTKSFESESRNVEINLLREKVEEAEVKMLGITNNNYFNAEYMEERILNFSLKDDKNNILNICSIINSIL